MLRFALALSTPSQVTVWPFETIKPWHMYSFINAITRMLNEKQSLGGGKRGELHGRRALQRRSDNNRWWDFERRLWRKGRFDKWRFDRFGHFVSHYYVFQLPVTRIRLVDGRDDEQHQRKAHPLVWRTLSRHISRLRSQSCQAAPVGTWGGQMSRQASSCWNTRDFVDAAW